MKYPIFPAVAALAAFGLAGCGEPPTAEATGDGVRQAANADTDADRTAELQQQLAALERRKIRIEDANAIKRLQRAYGYYVDRAMWNEVADLFAENGSIEIGRDGVYQGKDRVREYLLALGDGRVGLAEGELNEHMQLMPVVTLSADGTTAKGRWRGLVMAGRYGDSAVWGEGPYENEYVKEDGVWKIAKLHWFQTFMVPYDGGWAGNVDVNDGLYVSDRLQPDAPPSADYDPWPATWLPPFHFANPVTGAAEARGGADSAARSSADAAADTGADAASLAGRAAVLAHEVGLLEDENEIEILQRTYGFYIEEALWSQAADLFTEDGTLEIAGRGIWSGKERVLEYLRSITDEYPRYGLLYDQMQLQPVVHVAPDGLTAKGRWRVFAQEAEHGEFAEWGVGWYENDYVKQDGVWRIRNLRRFNRMYTPYEDGWAETALDAPSFSSSLEPDRPSTIEHAPYPAVPTAPFHYDNPVTGEPVYAGAPADAVQAPETADLDAVAETLASLERRVGLLEDADQIERLHAIYGYYLADYQMDDLGAMFADDGTIEIAQRGVYVGKASVRRNLDLYPPVDLHNHMQYQPVIHVAPDGMTANMRSRAFSIMGTHEEFATWMGGVYENTFVKDDGVWKISKDQVFNTYFTPYDVGWKDQEERDPPGITESNPPDLPPSVEFDMYPVPFLPPFHYPNPVTGQPVEAPPQD